MSFKDSLGYFFKCFRPFSDCFSVILGYVTLKFVMICSVILC